MILKHLKIELQYAGDYLPLQLFQEGSQPVEKIIASQDELTEPQKRTLTAQVKSGLTELRIVELLYTLESGRNLTIRHLGSLILFFLCLSMDVTSLIADIAHNIHDKTCERIKVVHNFENRDFDKYQDERYEDDSESTAECSDFQK